MPHVSGLLAGLALIVAIGAQNVFVLTCGMRRREVPGVVAICLATDVVLICLGTAGMGRAVSGAPVLVEVVRWAGAAFLTGYAALAMRRALRPGAAVLGPNGEVATRAGASGGPSAPGRARTLWTAFALSVLNPHVYLDTVFLLGGMAASHAQGRWLFAAGAICASTIWFLALGYGASLLAPLFARPGAWRLLDGVIAVTMLALAAGLLLR